MLTRVNKIHDETIAQNSWNWHETTWQSFSKQNHIRSDMIMVRTKKFSSSTKPSLDFVAYQQRIVSLQNFFRFL